MEGEEKAGMGMGMGMGVGGFVGADAEAVDTRGELMACRTRGRGGMGKGTLP